MSVSAGPWRSYIRTKNDPHAWYSADDAYGQRVALASLYVWAAAVPMWSVALVQLAELVLLLLAIRLAVREPREVLSHPLFWLTCFFAIYVFLRGWAASVERPDLFFEHWEGTRRWVKAGLLPAFLVMLGIWASGAREKHNVGLLLTLLVGLTAQLLLGAEWPAFWAGVGGQDRYAFDLMLAFSSLIFGMAFMGTLIFFPRVLRAARGVTVRYIAVCIAWGGLSLFYLAALVASGTRAAWIATAAGIAAAVVTAGFRWRGLRPARREMAVVLVSVALLTVVAVYAFGPRISERLMPATDAMASGVSLVVGQEELSDIPSGSLGVRIAYNVFGAHKFAERPVFGYGPANPIHLNSGQDVPYQIRGRTDHFHSQLMDALLRLGLVGLLPIVGLFMLALWGIHRGWRSGRLAPSTGVFFIGFIVGFLVWSLANARFANYSVSGHLGLVTGIACSYLLPRRGDVSAIERTDETSTSTREFSP